MNTEPPTPPAGETPETDAKIIRFQWSQQANPMEYIHPDFARDLERRLTRALAELDEARALVKKWEGIFKEGLSTISEVAKNAINPLV